jgi:GNAT superfamily N-acetyltransferase
MFLPLDDRSGCCLNAGMIRRMNDAVILRTVDRFPEPAFTELVDRLLHDPDRRSMRTRFMGSGGAAPTVSQAQQVRIGAFAGEKLVGWSHGHLPQAGVFYVSSSAVEHEYRRQGIYTRLIAAMELEARALGCTRIDSNHRAANAPVLIAKMKIGYVIVGTEFTGEMGLLVKLSKQLDPRREEIFQARAGTLEGAARFFAAEKPSGSQ